MMAKLKEWGFPVHKDAVGPSCVQLGCDLEGGPPQVFPGAEKQWLAIECCWEMVKTAQAEPKVVESVVSLICWEAMIARGLLSCLDKVYG